MNSPDTWVMRHLYHKMIKASDFLPYPRATAHVHKCDRHPSKMVEFIAESTSFDVDDSRAEEENRVVMTHYVKLCCALEEINIKSVDGVDQVALTAALQQIQQAAYGLNRYLPLRLAPKYFNELRLHNSTLADKTFNIPELLEHILQRPDHRDVVSMTQVNKTLRDIIGASAKLQTRLYLKAADPSRLRENEYDNFFENKYPGLSVSTEKHGHHIWSI